jgi:hypothetical protein
MRRLLILLVVAVAFSLPLVSAGSPDVPAVDVTSPEAAPAEPQTSTTVRAAPDITSSTSPRPHSAPTKNEVPLGTDFWVFHGQGLPQDFIDRVGAVDGVVVAYPYTAGTMDLVESRTEDGTTTIDQATPGWAIPLDGAIVAQEHIATYLGADHGLTLDHVVLGEGAAALRGLTVGDTMRFASGAELTIGAIVPDEVFGESEIIGLSADMFDPTRFETRAAVIRYEGGERSLERALAAIYGDDSGFGLHRRDAFPDNGPRIVRSWVFMKRHFGEFEYRPGRGGAVEIEPAWIEDHIVEIDLPLLGTTKCHRRFAHTLEAVMRSLEADGMADVIDPSRFYGCWNPRFIRGTTRLSRHSFGIAADINFTTRTGDRRGSPTHSALIEAMYAYGVHSGHVWTRPDPGHFEYYGFPDGPPTGGPL